MTGVEVDTEGATYNPYLEYTSNATLDRHDPVWAYVVQGCYTALDPRIDSVLYIVMPHCTALHCTAPHWIAWHSRQSARGTKGARHCWRTAVVRRGTCLSTPSFSAALTRPIKRGPRARRGSCTSGRLKESHQRQLGVHSHQHGIVLVLQCLQMLHQDRTLFDHQHGLLLLLPLLLLRLGDAFLEPPMGLLLLVSPILYALQQRYDLLLLDLLLPFHIILQLFISNVPNNPGIVLLFKFHLLTHASILLVVAKPGLPDSLPLFLAALPVCSSLGLQ
mmetsp:Transcript_31276/g.50652  ORF Transcript_31276/g.50652 Transcript_31276/m.50652 type:complete len:276 (+) Transcript_31276:24-851(+)